MAVFRCFTCLLTCISEKFRKISRILFFRKSYNPNVNCVMLSRTTDFCLHNIQVSYTKQNTALVCTRSLHVHYQNYKVWMVACFSNAVIHVIFTDSHVCSESFCTRNGKSILYKILECLSWVKRCRVPSFCLAGTVSLMQVLQLNSDTHLPSTRIV